MPRGGRRGGQPGKSYTNRTDLNATRKVPVAAAPGQTYGKAAQQVRAQQVVPVAAPPGPALAQPTLDERTKAYDLALPGRPDQTQRPDEPLTAGMDRGPGPGRSALPVFAETNTSLAALRALYVVAPNEDLRRLIEAQEPA